MAAGAGASAHPLDLDDVGDGEGEVGLDDQDGAGVDGVEGVALLVVAGDGAQDGDLGTGREAPELVVDVAGHAAELGLVGEEALAPLFCAADEFAADTGAALGMLDVFDEADAEVDEVLAVRSGVGAEGDRSERVSALARDADDAGGGEDAAELVGDERSGSRPCGAVALEALADEGMEGGGQKVAEGDVALGLRADDGVCVAAGEGAAACKGCVDEGAEAVDVGAVVAGGRVGLDDFGGEVAGCADALGRAGLALHEERETEVDNLGLSVGRDEDVVGLEVAVDDLAFMSMLQRVCDLDEGAEGLLRVDGAAGLFEDFVPAAPFDELHDDVGHAGAAVGVDLDDVGVVEPAEGVDLGAKPAPLRGVKRQQLERDGAEDRLALSRVAGPEDFGVAEFVGGIDDAEPSAAELTVEAVGVVDDGTNLKHVRSERG